MPTALPIPTNADELREMLSDRSRMGEILNDPDQFETFISNYVDASSGRNPDVMAQVNEQCEKFMLNWLRENGTTDAAGRLNLRPDSPVRPPHSNDLRIYNPKAIGAEFDDDFDTMSNFMYSISDKAFKTNDRVNKLEALQNALSSQEPSEGGFLIPERLRSELLRLSLERAVVRPRSRVIPMDSLRVPFPAIDSTSHASSVFGGITGFWTEEGATLTESNPKFRRVVLEAHKLTLYTEAPNELLTDSNPALAMLLGELFPEAMAWFEDVAFFIGGGVGEPLGFLNAAAAVEVSRDAQDEISWDDVVGMYSRMLPQGISRAVWVVSPEVFPQLANMQSTDGTNGGPVFIGSGTGPSGSDSPPMSLLGRPIIVSEKARQLGTAGDINFVDFGYYLIGDRQAMSARQSEDFRFKNDVTAFRVIQRLDGRPWLNSAITPQNGSTATLTPFVKLDTNTA